MITKLNQVPSGVWYLENGKLNFSYGPKDDPQKFVIGARKSGSKQYEDPTGNKFVDFQVDKHHLVALNDKGEVFGLGENKYGRMPGKSAIYETPFKIDTPAPVKKLLAGIANTHILTTDGKIYGVGSSARGQLGEKINSERTRWTQLAGTQDLKFTDINASGVTYVGKTDTGDFYQWGSRLQNNFRQDTSSTTHIVPTTKLFIPKAYEHDVLNITPIGALHDSYNIGEMYATLKNGTVCRVSKTAKAWGLPLTDTDGARVRDISSFSESRKNICLIKDNGDVYSFRRSGAYGGSGIKTNLHDVFPVAKTSTFSYAGTSPDKDNSVFFVNEGLPYVLDTSTTSIGGTTMVSHKRTKLLAIKIGKTLDYSDDILTKMMIGCK